MTVYAVLYTTLVALVKNVFLLTDILSRVNNAWILLAERKKNNLNYEPGIFLSDLSDT